jgi:hypothetical protein
MQVVVSWTRLMRPTHTLSLTHTHNYICRVNDAGGGLLDEANATNTAMETLLGIKEISRTAGKQDVFNATVRLIKQDIKVDAPSPLLFASCLRVSDSARLCV